MKEKLSFNKVIPVQQSVHKILFTNKCWNFNALIIISDNFYEITTLFLETTPGRLIFSHNFKKAIKI